MSNIKFLSAKKEKWPCPVDYLKEDIIKIVDDKYGNTSGIKKDIIKLPDDGLRILEVEICYDSGLGTIFKRLVEMFEDYGFTVTDTSKSFVKRNCLIYTEEKGEIFTVGRLRCIEDNSHNYSIRLLLYINNDTKPYYMRGVNIIGEIN